MRHCVNAPIERQRCAEHFHCIDSGTVKNEDRRRSGRGCGAFPDCSGNCRVADRVAANHHCQTNVRTGCPDRQGRAVDCFPGCGRIGSFGIEVELLAQRRIVPGLLFAVRHLENVPLYALQHQFDIEPLGIDVLQERRRER